MQIDTAGTYTLKYTAEDECGNVTEVTREVEAVQISYRTVLYTDGTFIINEKSTDRAANIALHGAVTNEYDAFDPNGATARAKYIFTSSNQRPWYVSRASIKSVEIGAPISPTSTAFWFDSFEQCTDINLTNLDTSNVTTMENMFYKCRVLPSVDVSSFDTSNVTDMSSMFNGCYALTLLDISSFVTSSVTDMSSMFNGCHALTSLDVSSFDTSSVTDMSSMFNGCHALQTLDLSTFNTTNVTNMKNMFIGCSALTLLDISSFVTSSVTDMSSMFIGCSALTSLDVSSFDTSSVTTMWGMFNGCNALQTLDLSTFNTTNVTDMGSMFRYNTALTTILASALFITTQVTNSSNMFSDMSSNLVGGAGTTWAASKPKDKTYAHIDGGTSNPGYFTLKSA